MAFSGNGDFPCDIFSAAPLGRDAFSGADPVAAWPTPARPVFGSDQSGHKKEQHNQTHAGSLASSLPGTRSNSLLIKSNAVVKYFYAEMQLGGAVGGLGSFLRRFRLSQFPFFLVNSILFFAGYLTIYINPPQSFEM